MDERKWYVKENLLSLTVLVSDETEIQEPEQEMVFGNQIVKYSV
jgi:hypothetical protein